MSNDLLKAKRRELVGKNAVRKVRSEHYVPGVLYGHHIESQSIKVAEHDLEKLFKHHGTGASLTLDVEGEKTFVLLKDIQINRLKNETLHVEFQALSAGEKIRLRVPIHYTGKDKIPAGIVFQELHHEVEMSVLPKDLIEDIVIDVSKVKLGEHALVKDLDLFNNDAYEILDDPDIMLYTLSEPAMPEEEEEVEEAFSPSEVPVVGEEEA